MQSICYTGHTPCLRGWSSAMPLVPLTYLYVPGPVHKSQEQCFFHLCIPMPHPEYLVDYFQIQIIEKYFIQGKVLRKYAV